MSSQTIRVSEKDWYRIRNIQLLWLQHTKTHITLGQTVARLLDHYEWEIQQLRAERTKPASDEL